MQRPLRLIGYLIVGCVLSGCAGLAAVGSITNAAMGLAGVNKPEVPESQKPPRQVPVSLVAGANLNADGRGRSQAAVIRIYKLKDVSTFSLAGFDTFVDPVREKAVLGDNLIEMKEITLIPGQQYNFTEAVPRTAKVLGIVALFHSPAPRRWKVAFDVEQSEKTGVLAGIHACAMTVTRGSIVAGQSPSESQLPVQWGSLLAVNCKPQGG